MYCKVFEPNSYGKDPLSAAADLFRGSLITEERISGVHGLPKEKTKLPIDFIGKL